MAFAPMPASGSVASLGSMPPPSPFVSGRAFGEAAPPRAHAAPSRAPSVAPAQVPPPSLPSAAPAPALGSPTGVRRPVVLPYASTAGTSQGEVLHISFLTVPNS